MEDFRNLQFNMLMLKKYNMYEMMFILKKNNVDLVLFLLI